MMHAIFDAVAQGNLELVGKALACGTLTIEPDDWSDYKLLVLSLKHKHKEIAKLLLDAGCRVQNTFTKDFVSTPLYYAIKMQDAEILNLLLKKGITLDSIDHKCESPFELILETCNKQITNLILNAYANERINPFDYEGFSPFHIACYVGNARLIEKFLNFGNNYVNCCVNISARFYAGFSPLHFAIETECAKIVKLLLDCGADVTLENADGKSSFYLACERKIQPIMDLLCMVHFSRNVHAVQDKGFSVLHSQVFYTHMNHFNISYKIDLSGAAYTSWSPLHYAVAQRKLEMVEFLLSHEADVNAKDDRDMTPLHLACQCSLEEFTKIVSSSCGVPLDRDHRLDGAQLKIVKLLLARSGKVNAVDAFGKTPLFHALENFVKIVPIGMSQKLKVSLIARRKELVHLLLVYGADLRVSDNEDVTVLHDLCECDVIFEESDKIEMARLVLAKGALVNAKTKANKTPLFLAIRNKFVDLARVLIDHEADIKCTCNIYNNFTALHTLAFYTEYNKKSVDLLYRLLERGADVHAKEVDEATALHIAIDCHGYEQDIPDDRDEMALALLRYGAEVDARDKHGQTALHRACLNRYTKGAVALLDHGADINAEDEFENTPLSYACYRVQEDTNTVFFYTVRHHVHKLNHVGLRVSEKIKLNLSELEKFYAHRFAIAKIDKFLEACAAEVERMKRTKIDGYTSLYDVLFKNLTDMVSHVKNNVFAAIFKSDAGFREQFELYGFLLRLQYERGLKRAGLMEPAEEALRLLINCDLPGSCSKTIFEHLTDAHLQALIDASGSV